MKLLLLIGIIMFLDVGNGLQGFRKYLKAHDKPFYIPNDLLAELFVAFLLCFMYLWTCIKFNAIGDRNSRNTLSWEASQSRPNFKTFTSKRGYFLRDQDSQTVKDFVKNFMGQ